MLAIDYWLSSARDYALSLACRLRGLSPFHGRGFDDLPPEVRESFLRALPVSLQPKDLLTALRAAIDGLLLEAAGLGDFATRVEPRLRELLQA